MSRLARSTKDALVIADRYSKTLPDAGINPDDWTLNLNARTMTRRIEG